MPLYRVQLKQGSRTITNHIEAKSVDAVLQFYNSLTTMLVSEILEVKYSNNSNPPVDDMNYYKLYKGILYNNNRASKQIILHNVKLGKDSNDILASSKQFLEVGGLPVVSLTTGLFKAK